MRDENPAAFTSPELPAAPSGEFHAVLDALAVGVCCLSLPQLTVTYRNPAFASLLELGAGEPATLAAWVCTLAREADRVAINDHVSRLTADTTAGAAPSTFSIVSGKDGTNRLLAVHLAQLPPAHGPSSAPGLLLTVVEQRQAPEPGTQADAAALLLAHSHEMIIISSDSERARYASPAVTEVTGWTPQEYVAREQAEMVHPEDRAGVRELRRKILEQGHPQPLRYRTLVKDGTYRWVEGYGAPYRDPLGRDPTGYVVTLRDIAKQKEYEDLLALENSQLAELAQIDELTGIANRRFFKTALNREARRKSRSSQALALLLLDIDNFKKYNDTYGHLQGDACLRQVAQALKKVLHRVADMVARYGGEEFVMLLPMTEPEGAERVAQNVLQAISALRIPHSGSSHGIVTVSVGVSTWATSMTMDEERLIEQADRALYRAKNQGRNAYAVNHCLPEQKASTS